MNDIQIKCFMKAAEYENFTKAAEAVYITQPVLGRHIANLEEELGYDLFQRERKAVRLTPEGAIFMDFIKECSKRYTDMELQVQAMQRSTKKEIILGTVEGQMIGEIYPKAIQDMLTEHPDINLKIQFFAGNDAVKALEEGRADALIASDDMVRDRPDLFAYQKLTKITNGLIIPAKLQINQEKDPQLTDFSDYCFIRVSELFDGSEDLAIRYNKTTELIGSKKIIDVTNVSTLAVLLESGVGISSLPQTHKLCKNPEFCFYSFPELNVYADYDVIAWKKDSKNLCIKTLVNSFTNAGYYVTE